jgi:hypothetical protein
MIAGRWFQRIRPAFWAILAASAAAGCDKRSLAWTYAQGASGVVAEARAAAIVQEPVGPRYQGQESREIAGALGEELMKKGLAVVFLYEPGGGAVYVASAAPASAPAADPQSQPASPAAAPGAIAVRGGGMLARYSAARQAHADVLLEVEARVHTSVDVYDTGGPYWHYGRRGWHGRRGYWGYDYYGGDARVLEYRSIPSATLRISDPRAHAVLATVTVRYQNASDSPSDVAKDLALGLDLIRDGWSPRTVTLKGKPGKVKIEPPLVRAIESRREAETQPAAAPIGNDQ